MVSEEKAGQLREQQAEREKRLDEVNKLWGGKCEELETRIKDLNLEAEAVEQELLGKDCRLAFWSDPPGSGLWRA